MMEILFVERGQRRRIPPGSWADASAACRAVSLRTCTAKTANSLSCQMSSWAAQRSLGAVIDVCLQTTRLRTAYARCLSGQALC